MAIALKLETREQNYNIYGGSAGFSKVIQATGLVDANLTTEKLLEVFSDLERRKAIITVLLDEGEFEPEVDFSTKPKRDALTLKLAKQLDTSWIIMLFASLANELNEAAVGLSGAGITSQADMAIAQSDSPSELMAKILSNPSADSGVEAAQTEQTEPKFPNVKLVAEAARADYLALNQPKTAESDTAKAE